MQLELKRIQRETGVTFVFVTHDQQEALTMSDRVAVMSEGWVEQIGSPEEIYHRPATAFVANFIGEANLLRGLAGGDRLLMIRPERIRISSAGPSPSEQGVQGAIREVIFRGPSTHVGLDTAAGPLVVNLTDGLALDGLAAGGSAWAVWSEADAYPVPAPAPRTAIDPGDAA
jgi:putative spermidine/putrescine transport system ATP-binding protein